MGYYYGRSRNSSSSIFDAFTLDPLPYPVFLILAVVFIFLGLSWFGSYESAVEAAEEQFKWVLWALPVVIIILVRWLSTLENPEKLLFGSNYDRHRRSHNYGSSSDGTGGFPWGVAAMIVLLLVLVQFQSFFLDSWFI